MRPLRVVARRLTTPAILSASAAALAASSVVVTVGHAQLTVLEIEQRLARLPGYQLATLGADPAAIRRNFVERLLLPELAFDEEARRLHLDDGSAMHDRIRAILTQALETELRSELVRDNAVNDTEIQGYFDAHRTLFETPRRIRIWRIVVADRALAERILAEARGSEGLKLWSKYAREQSLDKATNQRDGDLGFVRADGSTDVPQVHANPTLFAAADPLADGELAPAPVAEGGYWAAIWRRGSMPAITRTLDQERDAIRAALLRSKLEQRMAALGHDLEQRHVRHVHYEFLDELNDAAFGDGVERERPGILPRRRARPIPEKTDRGYR